MIARPRQIPWFEGKSLPGVCGCYDMEGLLGALASGAKQVVAGQSMAELSPMLPIPHTTDVLHLVGESRLLHGDRMAAELAHTLNMRLPLEPDTKPLLRLAFAELLQNAIEHGNLGLSLTRSAQVDEFEWFESYHRTLTQALEGPLGRIPVRVSVRNRDNNMIVEIEDRGLGFRVRETLHRVAQPNQPTGRGIGLLQRALKGTLSYDAGGRVVRFSLPLLQEAKPISVTLRSKARVLAWGHTPARTPLIERALRSAGCQNVATRSALKECLADAKQSDLVVLDGEAPNFAALAYALADLPQNAPTTPVLLFSPRAHEKACVMALNHPCMDVASTGSGPEELGLRLERLLQTQHATQKHDRLEEDQRTEIERTRSFQQDILPKPGPLAYLSEAHKVQVASSYRGCETLAGDYFAIREVSPTHLSVALMDFTGHGVRAALNTVQLHALLKTDEHQDDPLAISKSLNSNLHQLLGPGSFAAYVYLVLNTTTGAYSYCAGGAPPLLLKTKNGAIKEVPCNGLPLGLAAQLVPQVRQGQLERGESLLMASDALPDALHKNGARWGTQGLTKAWKHIPAAMAARPALQAIMEAFNKSVTLPVADDLTVVVVKR